MASSPITNAVCKARRLQKMEAALYKQVNKTNLLMLKSASALYHMPLGTQTTECIKQVRIQSQLRPVAQSSADGTTQPSAPTHKRVLAYTLLPGTRNTLGHHKVNQLACRLRNGTMSHGNSEQHMAAALLYCIQGWSHSQMTLR